MFEIKQREKAPFDFGRLSRLEWLEAHGQGGFASGTVSGANTRRYHGLLVAAVEPPAKRMVLVSRLDETIKVGPLRFELGCNQYPGAISPQGYLRLESFTLTPFPTFLYRVGEILIQKTIAAIHGENTTAVLYEVKEAVERFRFELQPFLACRDYHALSHANDNIARLGKFSAGNWTVKPYADNPQINISVPGSAFEAKSGWFHKFEYLRDYERGAEFREDLMAYGAFSLTLNKGDRLGVLISTEPQTGRDAFQLVEAEEKRRTTLVTQAGYKARLPKRLTLAADQFLVRRGSAKSVIAGYPWFTDWGRDTMIALPGLCILTKRYDDARLILEEFCRHVRHGLIPNCFPDKGGEPAYNTVDASLWFFVAVHEWALATGDFAFVKKVVLPKLLEIVEAHRNGTLFSIHMTEDRLLYAGDFHTQLTWMDAKVNGRPVTPRFGKPVEINALWYNALLIAASLCGQAGDGKQQSTLERLAGEVQKSFNAAFWFEEGSYLYDCLEGENRSASLRPNQIMALALPYPILPEKRAKQVLKAVETRLLTPYGLRTLAPGSSDYCGRYEGGSEVRDSAYHQGTVWPWLFGPYAAAVKRYGGKAQIARAKEVLNALERHLDEDGLNSIAEIFDGDEPQRPGGCPFQAWSVAEVLRAHVVLSK